MSKSRVLLAMLALSATIVAGRPVQAATTIVECTVRVADSGSGSCSATWSQSSNVQFGAHLATHVLSGTMFASATMAWTDQDGTLIYLLACESVYWPYDITVESEALPPSTECAEQNRGEFRPGPQTLTVTVADPICALDYCRFHGRLYVCSPGSSTRLQCRY